MALNHLQFLTEVFPFKTQEQIQNIITLVEEEIPQGSPEEKLENMYNMLTGDAEVPQNGQGAVAVEHGNVQGSADTTPSSAVPPMVFVSDGENSDNEEGAVGFGHTTYSDAELSAHLNQLQSLFPDASEEFLWEFCRERKHNLNLEDAIDELTRDGYEHKVYDVNTIWMRLQEALPRADPSYLKKQAEKLADQDPERLEEFVIAALDNNDYPTMQEYLKNKQEDDRLNFYRKNIRLDDLIKKILEEFPDPEKHFKDPNRQNPLLAPDLPEEDLQYAKTFLYNRFPGIRKKHVDLVFKMKRKNLMQSCDHLDHIKRGLKTKRPADPEPASKNLTLLQEIAYLKHRKIIRREIKYKNDVYRQFKEEARALNYLETCKVCGEDELIPEECFNCSKGCFFCKDCVRKYVEVRMGDGLTNFPCCECDSEFNLQILQMALPRNTFERLVLKIQSDEIKRANVDGLETCPFCDFASIPPEESKIFFCENPECLKESCRLCRHESHIPKRCDEIEYDEDVRRRTYIENMMTEALARTCHKCNRKFVKTNGCNKMVCLCGGMMCYLCSQAITGYDHFGGRCQLFTNDAQIDLERVKAEAEKAKRNLGDVKIKFDPSEGIENFFTT